MHVSAYITHVRTQLKQTIPKAIVHCLVRACAWSGCLVQGGPGMTAHPRPSHPCPPPSAAQVLKAKKQLLDDLQKDVASADDGGLRRWLSEDEATVRRREACAHRLRLLRQAADEVSAASL